MILKKPYAFLIKRFKLIHIVLTILTIGIAISSYQLVSFFRQFISNGYTITVSSDIVSTVVNPVIYLSLAIVILALVAIMVVLKSKNKSTKVYLFGIMYYAILTMFIIIASGLISGLQMHLWSPAEARSYRDFANIIYYVQFFFIIIFLVRALGFNVKQFNFKHDLQELEITEKDSEEIELNINFQGYKYARSFRRFIRELKYYYLENKFLITVIGIILVIVLGIFGIKKYDKLTNRYKEDKQFTIDTFKINITDSMITNMDQGGNNIINDKVYLVIRMDITNNGLKDTTLNYDNLKLTYKDKYIYPSLDLGKYFKDFGTPYMGGYIKAKESGTYIIPYIIDKDDINNTFKISIYTGNSTKSEDFKYKNNIIKLNPKKLLDINTVSENKMGEEVSFRNSLLNNTSLTINNYLVSNRYEYKYNDCYNENCRSYTDVVVADNTYFNRQALIVLFYDINFDTSTGSYKNINDIGSFADAFMTINYKKNGNNVYAKVKNITPNRIKDKLIIQTSGDIYDVDNLNLIITIRDKRYIIKLK